MRGKNKKVLLCIVILCGIICIGILRAVNFRFANPASEKEGYQVMLAAYPYEEGTWYQEYDYGYQKTPERLFGENCEYVFYGKIIGSKLFHTNQNSHSESSTLLAYALLQVKVLNNIYGELEKGDKICLVMPYSGYTAEEYGEVIQKGGEGLFIPKTPMVEVTFHDTQRKVDAIGMVGETDNRFCNKEELLPELKRLDSLDEAKDFWEENELCSSSNASEVGSR